MFCTRKRITHNISGTDAFILFLLSLFQPKVNIFDKSNHFNNGLFMFILVVPIYAAVGWPNLDFMNYLTIWESLPNDAKRVGELVGIEERFLVRAMRGTINTQIPTQVT